MKTKYVFFLLLCALPGWGSPSLPVDHLPVPIVRQSTDYSCAPAALLSVLQYWGLYSEPESSLFAPLKTSSSDGTRNEDAFRVALELGLSGTLREKNTVEDLAAALARRETVILDIQAWRENTAIAWKDTWEDGHYVVLVAMDREYLYLMDPMVGTGYTFLPIHELMDRWHDYEIQEGKIRRFYQLALFLKGKTPLPRFPAVPVLLQ